MASIRAFERELQVATQGLGDKEISQLLAQTAREALAEAQGAGEFPENYTTLVNGRINAPLESVEPPGPIVFQAQWWPEIITYGLEFARQRSPVRSGRFKAAWFAMVNGSQTDSFDGVAPDAEVIITNDQPYSRKIEVGAIRVNVPPGVVEDTVSALRRRFGDLITAQRRFINLEGAYRLRQSHGRRRARQAGRAISYPAAVISMRI